MKSTHIKSSLLCLVAIACLVLTNNESFAQTKPKKSKQTDKQVTVPGEISQLLTKHTCFACHKPDQRLVGPAYTEVAKKKYTSDRIVELIYKPEPKNWPGYSTMVGMTNVPKEDALKIANWINTLAK